jgi:hypothetical protein
MSMKKFSIRPTELWAVGDVAPQSTSHADVERLAYRLSQVGNASAVQNWDRAEVLAARYCSQ